MFSLFSLSHRFFAMPPRSFALADIGTAINGVATLLASYVGDVLIFVLVIAGYLYMTSIGDAQNGMHAKRAIGAAVAGGILVAVAINFGPELVAVFKK